MSLPRVLCLAALLLLAVPADGGEQSGGLPAEECVRLMRAARIAHMHQDPAAELAKLEAAVEVCPDEIVPIYNLVGYYRRQSAREEDYRKMLTQLSQRLGDPGYDLPLGVVEYLIRDLKIERSALEAILGNVSRQVAKAAEPGDDLMRIQAQLQQRLGRDDAAAETLEKLWRQSAATDLLWPLIHLYTKLDRWQDAADLMAPQVAKNGRFRSFYAHALGKLGRYEEVLEQVRILASGAHGAAPVRSGDSGAIELELAVGGYVVDVVDQPGLVGLLKQVAWDLRDLGRDTEAEQIFRGLLAQVEDDLSLQATVLNLYAGEEERQSHAQALTDTWQAETDPNVLFEEGTQRLTAGDAAGAIDLLKRAAPEFPDLEAAWYNLGMAAYRLEDWTTVASAFARAAELNPSRAQTFFFRGIALEQLDRCAEAVPDLERAVELDPDRALAYYYLARCHQKLGNEAAAQTAMQRYDATKD